MKCPKCQFEIPHGLKFCVECGHKLENLPKGILDKVLSQRSKIEGEKKGGFYDDKTCFCWGYAWC